jgi:hypothetical protein
MPYIVASGTATSVVASEVTLATEAANRNYMLVVNTSGLQASEVLDVRLYTHVISGATLQLADQDTHSGVQSVPIKLTDPIASPHAISARIEQLNGSPRNFVWELIAI